MGTLPGYIHLFVVLGMMIASVVVFLLLLGDLAPKKKSYYGSRMKLHSENDALKLFLLLSILAGFFFLKFTGFKFCDFLTYWAAGLKGVLFFWSCK
jgi:hypothetical protein